MEPDIPPAFWSGIEQFNQRDFYECHDTLEALWMEAGQSERTFYQGILQIAVAFYHMGNHNWQGTVILLGEGVNRLKSYQPSYFGINVEHLLNQSVSVLTMLQQNGPDCISDLNEKFLQAANHPTLDLTDASESASTFPQIVKVSD
ncbi:MAG TPA: DUF309 domain-containing protein [Elainellaceae cyanobacterium]